jgi:hypothetical protein
MFTGKGRQTKALASSSIGKCENRETKESLLASLSEETTEP